MTFKTIVEILKLYELAPIHYHTYDKNVHTQQFFCKHISDAETDDFFNNTANLHAPYDNSSLRVYFPKGTIKKVYEAEQSRNYISTSYVIKNISCIMVVEFKEADLVYAIYAALHEVGHWIYFKNCGLTSVEYASKSLEDGKSISRLLEKANKTRMAYYGQVYVEAYNNLPLEKVANDYAYANYLESYKKIKAYVAT